MNPAVEEFGCETEVGQAVAVGLGEALNETVEAQATQVITHSTRGDLGLWDSEQLRKQWPQLAIPEALGLEAEQDQRRQ